MLEINAYGSEFKRDQKWQLETDHRQLKFFCERKECDGFLCGRKKKYSQSIYRHIKYIYTGIWRTENCLGGTDSLWKSGHKTICCGQVGETCQQYSKWLQPCLATQSRGNRNELDYSFVNTIKQERNRGATGDQLQEMVDAEGLLGKGNTLETELFLSLHLHLSFPWVFKPIIISRINGYTSMWN